MKVNITNLNVTVDGPISGYLNVYKRTVDGEIFYTTGRKSYATVNLAIRCHRAPSDWEHVGTIPVEYYRNHVNAHIDDYKIAIKNHIIHDIDSFLARETRQAPPTSKPIKVKAPTDPVTEPVRKPTKSVSRRSKAKKPVKVVKATPKPKKAGKAPSKPKNPVNVKGKKKTTV